MFPALKLESVSWVSAIQHLQKIVVGETSFNSFIRLATRPEMLPICGKKDVDVMQVWLRSHLSRGIPRILLVCESVYILISWARDTIWYTKLTSYKFRSEIYKPSSKSCETLSKIDIGLECVLFDIEQRVLHYLRVQLILYLWFGLRWYVRLSSSELFWIIKLPGN